jgi:DNA polymerase elongation subunit (family B)
MDDDEYNRVLAEIEGDSQLEFDAANQISTWSVRQDVPRNFCEFAPAPHDFPLVSATVDLQVIDIHTSARFSGKRGPMERIVTLFCKSKYGDTSYALSTDQFRASCHVLPLESSATAQEIKDGYRSDLDCEVVRAFPVYPYVEKPLEFVRYSFVQPSEAKSFAEEVLRGPLVLTTGRSVRCRPYGCMNFLEQFQQETGVSGFGWIRVPVAHCLSGLLALPIQVVSGDDSVCPLRCITLDIECAKTKGLPKFDTNEIIVVSCVCVEYANALDVKRRRVVVFQLGRASAIAREHLNPDAGDAHICYQDERAMLDAFGELVRVFDPDFLAGHNSTGFDVPYLVQRANLLSCSPSAMYLGRVRPYKWLPPRTFSRVQKNGRTSESTVTDTPGRIQIDTLPWIQAIKQHRSYKLGALGSIYLGATKMDVPYQMIRPLWQGTDETRARLATYCLWDTVLTQGLVDHKDFRMVLTAVEMARTTRVPAGKLLRSGMQAKVFGVIYEKAMKPGFDPDGLPALFPYEHPKTRDKDDKYAGAVVLEPFRGYYATPVACGDFRSLYPSVMIAGNFCWSTVDSHAPRLQDSVPSPNGVWFVSASRRLGIIPQLQIELFAARDKAKAMMKAALQRGDPGSANLYNTRQNEVKKLMNSTYGILGASGGRCAREELALAVTSSGRDKLRRAISIAEAPPFGAEVVYGDSVTGDTPVLCRSSDVSCFGWRRVDSLLGDGAVWAKNGDKFVARMDGKFQVWTDAGWTAVRRLIMHRTTKPIVRVSTGRGSVCVTTDHSLLSSDGEPLKPASVTVGVTRLLHCSLPVSAEPDLTGRAGQAFTMGLFWSGGHCSDADDRECWMINHTDRKLLELAMVEVESHYLEAVHFAISLSDPFFGVHTLAAERNPRHVACDYRRILYARAESGNFAKHVPDCLLSASRETRRNFWEGLCSGFMIPDPRSALLHVEGQLAATGIYHLAVSVGLRVSLGTSKERPSWYTVVCCDGENNRCGEVVDKMEVSLAYDRTNLVYDLETDNHRFCAGVGSIVVHNTDSIFAAFPGVDTVRSAFAALSGLCDAVTASFAPGPIMLQAEKVMCPLEMVGKKKYIFNMYEGGADGKPKLCYKGVELARRDNCGLVIDCMTEVVDCIMNQHSPRKAREALDGAIRSVLLGTADINKLVIVKGITKDDYKCKPVHVAVSERMHARDPSYDLTGPGEKVPFVIVRRDGRTLADKAEDPLYAITHGYQIDGEYYIENQLAGPMSRVFMFVDMRAEDRERLRLLEREIRAAEFGSSALPEERIAQLIKKRKDAIEDMRKRTEREMFGQGALQRFTKRVTAGKMGIGSYFKPIKREPPAADVEECALRVSALKKKCDACRGFPSDDLSCAARDCPVLLERAVLLREKKERK